MRALRIGLRNHWLRRGLSPAERGFAGRVCRAARDPRLSRFAYSGHRKICLIPQSAHGTNLQAQFMAGFSGADRDLEGVTSIWPPSAKSGSTQERSRRAHGHVSVTHGVFETTIREICEIVLPTAGSFTWMARTERTGRLCRPVISARMSAISICTRRFVFRTRCGPGWTDRRGRASRHSAAGIYCRRESGRVLFGDARKVSDLRRHAGAGIAWRGKAVSFSRALWQRQHPRISDVHSDMGPLSHAATKVAILNANYIAKRLDRYFPFSTKDGTSGPGARVHRRSPNSSERGDRSGRCG